MKILNKYIDIFSGVLFIAFSLVLFVLATSIVQRATTEGSVGPQFLPKVIAVFILLSSACLVFTGVSHTKKGTGTTGSFPEQKRDMVTVLGTIVILILYVTVLNALGFMIASGLFLFAMLLILDINFKSHLLRNVIIAISVPVISYLLFRFVFSLTLPQGLLF